MNSWEVSDTGEFQSQFTRVKGDNVYLCNSCHYRSVNKHSTNYVVRLYMCNFQQIILLEHDLPTLACFHMIFCLINVFKQGLCFCVLASKIFREKLGPYVMSINLYSIFDCLKRVEYIDQSDNSSQRVLGFIA